MLRKLLCIRRRNEWLGGVVMFVGCCDGVLRDDCTDSIDSNSFPAGITIKVSLRSHHTPRSELVASIPRYHTGVLKSGYNMRRGRKVPSMNECASKSTKL
jgi:hypothetical protein